MEIIEQESIDKPKLFASIMALSLLVNAFNESEHEGLFECLYETIDDGVNRYSTLAS